MHVDTAGQERFRNITANYFRGCAGCLIVFDVTDKSSFDSVPRWMADVEKHATDAAQVVRVIVGNKVDMENRRQVSMEIASSFATSQGMEYFEASAKKKTNVEEAFIFLVKEITKRKGLALGNTTKGVVKPQIVGSKKIDDKPCCN